MTDKLKEFGHVMNKAHERLSDLGVSHPRLDNLVETARKNGALGAKLTGSGLGGVMVALAENEKDAIRISQRLLKMALKILGFTHFKMVDDHLFCYNESINLH